jgi:hypothetical protein
VVVWIVFAKYFDRRHCWTGGKNHDFVFREFVDRLQDSYCLCEVRVKKIEKQYERKEQSPKEAVTSSESHEAQRR